MMLRNTLVVALCLPVFAQTRPDPRQIRDWRQVQPLVGARAGTQIATEQLRIDPTLLAEWRREAIGPCVSYASVTVAPGSGPILVTGIGTMRGETEEAFYRDKIPWKFWFQTKAE